MHRRIHLSLAAYPRWDPIRAMRRAQAERVSEPLFGELSLAHVQICPQNSGQLTPRVLADLRLAYPRTQFRLHANARVLALRRVEDLDCFSRSSQYWHALRAVSEQLNAPAYTAHAGLRAHTDLNQVFDNTRNAEQFLGIPVGIEGHYPTPRDIYVLSTWSEYRALLLSGVKYALDLSHLHILATQTGEQNRTLIQELLANEDCIEVHVSTNDGRRDSHRPLDEAPWWWDLLPHAHPDAIIFSEGTQPDVH